MTKNVFGILWHFFGNMSLANTEFTAYIGPRPNGPPNALRSEAARLLSPLPHVWCLSSQFVSAFTKPNPTRLPMQSLCDRIDDRIPFFPNENLTLRYHVNLG